MQLISAKRKNKSSLAAQDTLRFLSSILILALTLAASLIYSEQLSHAARVGLSLCERVIIPSIFPFMIISDFICVTVDFSQFRLLSFAFEHIFRVNKKALSAFILGILCGFPLGVKRIAELYDSGEITSEDAEYLIGFCNNAGPAFIISGVGVGLRESVYDGIALYLALVISAALVGALFSIGRKKPDAAASCPQLKDTRFSPADSIRHAGNNTLTVCSFIVFFSCVCGAIRAISPSGYIYVFLSSFLEVGSATSIISKSTLLTPIASLSLCGFAVGFSGLSVHLQAKSFLIGTPIKMKKYYLMKLVQGVICSLILSLYYLVGTII